ncbi:hypothetical protein KC326_g59 [Hortaea werneckii]|nr:hypothetical protein KC326_g59 [Hortaea werneckii]
MYATERALRHCWVLFQLRQERLSRSPRLGGYMTVVVVVEAAIEVAIAWNRSVSSVHIVPALKSSIISVYRLHSIVRMSRHGVPPMLQGITMMLGVHGLRSVDVQIAEAYSLSAFDLGVIECASNCPHVSLNSRYRQM